MNNPAFYDKIKPITVRDPLAGFLGATDDGTIDLRYVDAVHLAGHSCPTVAGAWLMVRCALSVLYGGDLPVRGEIEVQMRDEPEEGVCGVIASVFTLVTGAASEGGFQGLAGKFIRRDLLSFGQEVAGVARFVRRDSGQAVVVAFDHTSVATDPAMMPLMQKALAGQADPEEEARFRDLWAGRVRAILIDHGDNLVTAEIEKR